MDCFERKNYESIFYKEELVIIRWDKMDGDMLARIFRQEQIRTAAESLVNYVEQFSGTDDMRKLSRYLYPAGCFDDMMYFLWCAVREKDSEEVLEFLNQNIEQSNPYNEPLWVLWGRFLTDVLDVLRQWSCYKDKVMERMPYF